MARAMELQEETRGRRLPERWRRVCQQAVVQVDRAAAALAQLGPKCEMTIRMTGAPLQQDARVGDRLQFKLPAADTTQDGVGGHHHARARFARRRTTCGHDFDDHRRAAGRRPGLGFLPQDVEAQGASMGAAAMTAVTARRMASGVAGACSGGSTRWPPAAETASRIAKNTLKGSSIGGSPTALLR